LTRHELKEQIQHDRFTDAVSGAVVYAQAHRNQLIRWVALAIGALILAGLVFWYLSYRNSVREQDLQGAFQVLDAPVGPGNPAAPWAKSFLTQDEKTKASIKALSDVVSKDGGSRQGLMAQYYRGTLEAQNGNNAAAEADLNVVANTSNPCAPLAKIALAQLYSGENKIPQARDLLQQLVRNPTDLVSKAQAQILLARLDEASDPKQAQKILQSLQTPNQDPAVIRAIEQIASQNR
jgi:hypothetical protein